jgi:hypothetical protein
MGLFDVVPGNFFSILVSGNREIYVEALMLLHKMFKFDLNIQLNDYISSLISILEDKAFIPEDDDEMHENSLTLSGKARLILNRFIKTGWIDKEFLDGSFIEIITPRNYAIPVMKLLGELGDKSLHEYNSLVFATYSGLKQAKSEHESQMYEAVLSARANTEQLEYELRALYHGIRGFLRDIQEQHDVNLLLQNHFEEYKRMSDRIYHPIKTMDSIHRYMAPIQNILSDILADDDLMRTMRDRAVTVKKYDSEIEAEDEIVSAIDYVLDAYRSVGGIINEIDRKHSVYTKSSIEKIQYLMTADRTVKGKLVEILKTYATASSEDRDILASMLEKNIRVNRQEFVDGKSLYHKNVRSRRIDAPPLSIERNDAFSDSAMADLMEQIKNAYPIARIRAYVDGLFADGSDFVESKDIRITNDTDFVLLILAVIRASDRGMPYLVQMEEGRTEHNGYRFPNMIIRKKEGKSLVE